MDEFEILLCIVCQGVPRWVRRHFRLERAGGSNHYGDVVLSMASSPLPTDTEMAGLTDLTAIVRL